MSYTIENLKDDFTPKLHDTSIDKLSGEFYDKVYEAARNVLAKLDPATTIRKQALTNALYDNVYSYIAPTDLKHDKVISIFPQADINQNPNFKQTGYNDFGYDKEIGSFIVEHESGVKTISIAGNGRAGLQLSAGNSLTENGTWAVGGQATNLELDNYIYVNAGGSLRFDLTSGATSGYLENNLTNAIDFDAYDDISAFFVWVYIPSITTLTSFNLRWGSSSGNYFDKTVTAAHDNTAFKVGWNLLRFDWSSASQTGTPTTTAIDYIRFTVNFTGVSTLTGFRLNAITGRIGEPYDVRYYSKYLFQNTAGTWIEKPTADTDIINLDTDTYNVLLYELEYIIAQELQGEDSSFDITYFSDRRKEAYMSVGWSNKSQARKPTKRYYRMGGRHRN